MNVVISVDAFKLSLRMILANFRIISRARFSDSLAPFSSQLDFVGISLANRKIPCSGKSLIFLSTFHLFHVKKLVKFQNGTNDPELDRKMRGIRACFEKILLQAIRET